MDQTDLLEVFWKKGKKVVSLKKEAPAFSSQKSILIPVSSPGVGVFRFHSRGLPLRTLEEGAEVRKGQTLGFLAAGPRSTPVPCPADGTLRRILAKEAQVADYGQPMFLIEPLNV